MKAAENDNKKVINEQVIYFLLIIKYAKVNPSKKRKKTGAFPKSIC